MGAAEDLEDLGLSKYESESFAALTALGEATASEVHEEGDVPRSSVYGALDRLSEKGLVEKSGSRPTLYRAVEPDEAMERLARDRREQEERALESLKERASGGGKGSKGGVWTIEGERNLVDRAKEIVDTSDERVWIMDYPGIVEELEAELSETEARTRIVTTADTSIETTPFLDEVAHPVEMNGFVIIGDDQVLVSFKREEGRTGIWSDSSGLLRLFEHFFVVSLERGLGENSRTAKA